MEFTNLSNKPLIFRGDKTNLERMITLPDYCPGKGILPVGLTAVYKKQGHEITSDYLGPDVGCGMTLAKFKNFSSEYIEDTTNKIASELISKRNHQLGSLGGGNHFIDIYGVNEVKDNDLGLNLGDSLALIHSGSRYKGKEVYELGLNGEEYLNAYFDLMDFGVKNRKKLIETIESASEDKLDIILDSPHNTLEITDKNVIYRKGSVKLKPGELGIIPSTMTGDAILVRAKDSIKEIENSMCHGTGRKMSRSDAKRKEFFLEKPEREVYIPYFISPKSIATELPQCYNNLEDIFPQIEPYVDVVARFIPKSVVML
jgi:tRNA-splicing ligase RtcB